MHRAPDTAKPQWFPLHAAAERLSVYLGPYTRFALEVILARGHVPVLATRSDGSAMMPEQVEDLLGKAAKIAVISHNNAIFAHYQFSSEQKADGLLGPQSNWRFANPDSRWLPLNADPDLRWLPLNFDQVQVCWATLMRELHRVQRGPPDEVRKLGLWPDSWDPVDGGLADNAPHGAEPRVDTLRPTPGPKGGEQSVDQLAWKIALQILVGKDPPTRGHGRLTALSRTVNIELARQGHTRRDDSIRKAIGPGLRAWEAANPDK